MYLELPLTMRLKTILIASLFILTACKAPSAASTVTPTISPSKTSVPTATIAPAAAVPPSATLPPVPAPSDVFGAIPLNSVQAFSLEPIAKAIFEQTLQGYVAAGSIQEYRVDSLSVFPSGGGGLIAEIMYSLRTDSDPWVEDFGSRGADGWITGKCSRFDLVATEAEHQLRNKRLCS
jgi:hypothetical protein